jgi:hypothetical protein
LKRDVGGGSGLFEGTVGTFILKNLQSHETCQAVGLRPGVEILPEYKFDILALYWSTWKMHV